MVKTQNNELKELILVEKYRPNSLETIIFDKKYEIKEYIKTPLNMPSLIFSSKSPGTGKTSLAKIISNLLGCDTLTINSSDERGIETIREKIKLFAQSLSMVSSAKRLIFLDEADGITGIGQNCLRNLMETYSDNCFFILSCNELNKIIEPIQSRCKVFNFDKPDKVEIFERLKYICEKENIKTNDTYISNLIDCFYPDIRKCIMQLQSGVIEGCNMFDPYTQSEQLKQLIYKGDINKIYELVYSGDLDLIWFTKYFFKYIYSNFSNIGLEKCSKISILLADILKSWQLNISIEEIFLANITQIIEILK